MSVKTLKIICIVFYWILFLIGMFLILTYNSAFGAFLTAAAFFCQSEIQLIKVSEVWNEHENRINKTVKGVWKFIEEKFKQK